MTYEIDEETDGRWVAEWSLIPGVLAYGATPQLALEACIMLRSRVESSTPMPGKAPEMIAVPACMAEYAKAGHLFTGEAKRFDDERRPNDGSAKPAPTGPNELRACWCFECLDAPEHGLNNPTVSRMILCPACGNKRCPRATDHRYACTGSNEVGQFGSNYVLTGEEAADGSGADLGAMKAKHDQAWEKGYAAARIVSRDVPANPEMAAIVDRLERADLVDGSGEVPLDLDDALALTDALERNGGEDPFDLELHLEQTRMAVAVIRSLVAAALRNSTGFTSQAPDGQS